MRPITGAEVTLADGSHVTLLVETRERLREPLPAAHRRARAHPRPRRPSRRRRRSTPRCVAELNEGLVCLSGCARHGLATRDPNGAAAARAGVRPRAVLRRAAAPVRARRRAPATPRCATSPRRSASQTVVTGDVHAHHPRRAALQDVLVAIRYRTSLDGCEPERRGNHESVLLEPRAVGGALPARPRRGRAHGRARRAARVRPDRGPRLPLPRLLRQRRAGDPPARPRLRPRLRGALRRRERPQAPRARAARRRAEADRRARPRRLLPAPLGGARARARVRARGARRLGRAQRPAAGPRARQLGRLDRLLPDRPLARRPGAGRALARPLHQQRADLGARHRPRLPARHPREADRRGLRALRPRALGARRELLDLPRARRDPRRGQGARPAVRRAGAARAPDRRQPVPRRRGAGKAAGRRRQARVPALARLRPAVRRDRRPAAPHLAAPGRDGHLDTAARRARAGAAGGDGRAAALPVGQGLVRGRRLPEDRPARARDALGGRGLRRADRRSSTARRSTSRGSRSTTRRSTPRSRRRTPSASSRSRAARRCSRCCRRGPRTSTT